ncbi:MAG TPA: HEAT repeat domain-containing protein [Edaphobacter sp.]|nr:HEAT repeat domain-containing protein [Edaphobacter sp.]
MLLNYGELPDELAGVLEQHLIGCVDCTEELEAFQRFEERLATTPVLEPSPNLLAQSRMRLDDALDMIPPHGFLTQLRTNFYRWVGNVQSAPALATLLLGVGFLSGNFTHRYQVANAPKPKKDDVVMINHPMEGVIANVTGVVQTPNSELVQVNYNKIVPESMEGSLDSPEIRKLLLVGTNAAATAGVRMNAVSLLTSECKAGHACQPTADGNGTLHALMVSLRYDEDAGVRMKALEGLERYVGQDQHVRDAVLEAVAHDPDAGVRRTAIGLLEPVQSDSCVRQVLRTVASQDANPYIRTASYNALQNAADIQ